MKHRLQIIHRSLGLAALTGTLAATLAGTLLSGSVMAATPMAEKQAPGYYRMMLGSFEVTALSDGTVKLPVDDLLLNTTKEHVQERLADNFLSAPLPTSVNGYLINTGNKLVLIDTGAGSLFGPTLGNLANNMKASGYEPGQVDEIYLTHMHPDHVGGLISDGKIVFPNATIRANQDDADYWLSEEKLNAAAEGAKGFFKGAMASLNPYVEAGQFEAFDGNGQILPGISTIEAKGHTPGHTLYKVESDGNILMLWGDLIHVAAVQFPEPDIAIQFDTNSDNAVSARVNEFERAADAGYLVGSAHLSFPGLGHLTQAGQGYEFIPANYEAGE
ncbi:MAG TPA: MBL fold metallo-hydrolase [Marinobacter sp.]|uniref:MBL fold metallo-hydrolase n=2 Tax=root TaxID=1 RepID=A0A831VZX0_9GAMM|nr:MBL fold metallo-hydrolase [Marinobacter antarcticus]HDZ37366.1 MBL fold metallo-hydrolase [Marinobacter sp.]HEA52935.1 MBL fold metallo-hydrolase [Marinobacter antarcticus]